MKIHALAALKTNVPLEPFVYEKEVGKDEVLIAVKYCSLAGGDILFIDNLWGDTSYPYIPSLEAFGVVTEKGENVKDLKVGDYVGISYQMTSCMQCEYCKQGKEQFCRKQKVLGVNGFGALADYIVFDSRFVYKIPNVLQTPEHVSLMCSGSIPFSAIKKSGLKAGAKVGLVGIGNLGHITLQILNKLGCDVTVFSHSKAKETQLRALGARGFINSTDKATLEKEESKYDNIFSTSSGTLDWELYIKALKPQGTIFFIGLPPDKVCFSVELLADYAQRIIGGSYSCSRAELKELLQFAAKNDIKAITNVFPLSEVNNVVQKIRNKELVFSTVIKVS